MERVSERRVDTLTQRNTSTGKRSQESIPAKNIHSNSGPPTLTASTSSGKMTLGAIYDDFGGWKEELWGRSSSVGDSEGPTALIQAPSLMLTASMGRR
eukprot:scaffold391584_cov20-Prasinocladus_malaysianus.AAC.1